MKIKILALFLVFWVMFGVTVTLANTILTGFVEVPDDACGIDVIGQYAYIAGGTDGLQVIDISVPDNPYIVGSVDTLGYARDVSVLDSYAYVTDSEQGLVIIDISDPTNPKTVGVVDTPGRTGNFDVLGSYAYVADIDTGFYTIDIYNPANPFIVGSYNMPFAARDVFVLGQYAYVAGYNTGLNVFDIQDPSNPSFMSSVGSPPYCPRDIKVSGSYAYVADYQPGGPNGIYVIDISNYVAPTPEPATIILFGLGILGLAGINRKNNKVQAVKKQGRKAMGLIMDSGVPLRCLGVLNQRKILKMKNLIILILVFDSGRYTKFQNPCQSRGTAVHS